MGHRVAPSGSNRLTRCDRSKPLAMAARPLCRLVRAAGLRKIPDPDGALDNREQSGHVARVRRPPCGGERQAGPYPGRARKNDEPIPDGPT